MRPVRKIKLVRDITSATPWEVQLWNSYDGGKTFEFSGISQRFHDDADGNHAMREYGEAVRSPIRVFPLITPERQQGFEVASLAGTFTPSGLPLWSDKWLMEKVPDICGYYGRACHQMNDGDGADRALCMGCPLAEYSHGVELMEYAKGE